MPNFFSLGQTWILPIFLQVITADKLVYLHQETELSLTLLCLENFYSPWILKSFATSFKSSYFLPSLMT